MIRTAVLEALASAAEAGEGDEGALRRLRIDPVLAGAARKRLRRAVLEALLDAPVEGPALCRRAYLWLADQPPGTGESDAEVEARFVALRAGPRRPVRVSYLATALVSLVGVSLLGLLGLGLWRAAHPDAWHRRARPPAGVFLVGGEPTRVAVEAARVFQRDVVDYLLVLDKLSKAVAEGDAGDQMIAGSRVSREATRVDEACAKALPAPVCAALAELLGRARVEAELGNSLSQQTFLDAVAGLDDALAAAGLALYVDGDVISTGAGRRFVVLYSFVVEAVHVYRAGEQEVRALWLRRLDNLNFVQAAAGFVRPGLREALVLLDQTEGELVGMLVPAQASGAAVAIADRPDDDGFADFDGREALERLAGEQLRREWRALLGDTDAAAAARLGDALTRRTRTLDDLAAQLETRGLALARPDGLRMPGGWLDELAQGARPSTLDQLEAIDDELSSEAAARHFVPLRALLATNIELHEVQHRLDYAAGGRRMPAELEALVGPAEHDGQERRGAATARDEMSAYLSQLARSPHLVTTNLLLQARFLLRSHFSGGAECHAAVVIFEGLARELGLPAVPLIDPSIRLIDRAATARLLTSLLTRPPADVSSAASRLWTHLFGDGVAKLTFGG